MIGFKEISIGGYVLRFYPTDNKGWMCGITDEQLNALLSITALFSHPAKTLTDEEIDYCWSHSHGNTPWMKQKAFARAILRKAQEK